MQRSDKHVSNIATRQKDTHAMRIALGNTNQNTSDTMATRVAWAMDLPRLTFHDTIAMRVELSLRDSTQSG